MLSVNDCVGGGGGGVGVGVGVDVGGVVGVVVVVAVDVALAVAAAAAVTDTRITLLLPNSTFQYRGCSRILPCLGHASGSRRTT